MVEEKRRVDYIDLFRGLGILLMVAGYVGFGEKFDYIIHAFHMPMFYFVSGMFFDIEKVSKVTFIEFIKRKARSLLLPYFIFGVLHYCMWSLIHMDDFSFSPLLHMISVNTSGMPIAGALWFLTSIFLVEVIFFMMCKYVKEQKIVVFIVILLAIFGNLENIILPFKLPYAMGTAFVGIGFFLLANKIRYNQFVANKLYNIPCGINVLIVTIAFLLSFANGYINMRVGEYAIIILFWINAILWIVCLINFCKYVCNVINKNLLINLVMYIGKNSIVYLCLNEACILLIRVFLNRVSSDFLLNYINIINFLVTMMLLTLASWIVNKTMLRKVFGK